MSGALDAAVVVVGAERERQDARFAAFGPAQALESALVLAYGYKSKKNGFNLR